MGRRHCSAMTSQSPWPPAQARCRDFMESAAWARALLPETSHAVCWKHRPIRDVPAAGRPSAFCNIQNLPHVVVLHDELPLMVPTCPLRPGKKSLHGIDGSALISPRPMP